MPHQKLSITTLVNGPMMKRIGPAYHLDLEAWLRTKVATLIIPHPRRPSAEPDLRTHALEPRPGRQRSLRTTLTFFIRWRLRS